MTTNTSDQLRKGDRVQLRGSYRKGEVVWTYQDGRTVGVRYDNHKHACVLPVGALIRLEVRS